MLDAPTPTLRARAAPPLPVEALLVGKRVEEAAELLPRLFNLCRAAQVAAARLVFGMAPVDERVELARELRRDHVLRLAVTLPARLGKAPLQLRIDDTAVAALLGDAGFPAMPDDFDAFLGSDTGMAPLLRDIALLFGPGEAVAPVLGMPCPGQALPHAPLENTVAVRHLAHPVMRHVEMRWGRGPLWRVVARALDMDACARGALPAPWRSGCGTAVVPAARGAYGVSARVENGIVMAFSRVTPTDHLLFRGGVMDHSLATLPAIKQGLAPLLVDILDPCSPVRIEKGPDHA
ncbi:MAG: hydrogenase expression/formation protein HupK [Roseovarius sp.]